MTHSLNGIAVLVTRAAGQAEEFVRLIEERGGTAVVAPTIEILPPADWGPCDRAIDNLASYDGALFTSINGAEHFLGRLSERNVEVMALKAKRLFAVGEKTGQTLSKLGLPAAALPERFTAADLARVLEREDVRGKAFLFPRGNLASDLLVEHLTLLGATVEAVTVYETRPPRPDDAERLRALVAERKVAILSFTSPSTFTNFAALFSPEEMSDWAGRVAIAAIGPATARAVEERGLRVDILPALSTIEAMVEAMADYVHTFTKNNQDR
jgi:uroporphyrinogen III methyltransferase/synthase